MRSSSTTLFFLSYLSHSFLHITAQAVAAPSSDSRLAPLTQRDQPLSFKPLTDKKYLPIQIGGIVGAYAISLVLVALTLLLLSKKRREHLRAANDDFDFAESLHLDPPEFLAFKGDDAGPTASIHQEPVPNFSYPSPIRSEFSAPSIHPYVHHSPTSSIGAPGINPFVDQRVVVSDQIMAQQQLEEMYKYVMEHEEAKQRGTVMDVPIVPPPSQHRFSSSEKSVRSTFSRKERAKPANLNLDDTKDDKKSSKTASLLSALRSPKKKSVKGISISSPMMTPQSATFPRQESQEMNAMSPRHYVPMPPPPPPPPPVSTDYNVVTAQHRSTYGPITPDLSPESVQSIDERLGPQLAQIGLAETTHLATEVIPESATSEHSQAPLIRLPQSPKPGGRFPSLPLSPKPGATFQRSNAPPAVRTGGSLPLRAYEPAMSSPSITSQVTKQTVFERKGPLSPMSARTPGTAVPYSPYQPFTPCMPMTPSLVTKEDRKRMKRMVPKTPTIEMVQRAEDVW